MGQGTTTPAPDVIAAPGAPGTPPLTDLQAKAISMLMGQMGKGAPAVAGMGAQVQHNMPQTRTIQGGMYFNPQQPG